MTLYLFDEKSNTYIKLDDLLTCELSADVIGSDYQDVIYKLTAEARTRTICKEPIGHMEHVDEDEFERILFEEGDV